MNEEHVRDFLLLHVPVVLSAAVLFASFLLMIVRLKVLNIFLFGLTLTCVTLGLDYFGPNLSVNFAGYIPHAWIAGSLITFVIQYRLYGKYWE